MYVNMNAASFFHAAPRTIRLLTEHPCGVSQLARHPLQVQPPPLAAHPTPLRSFDGGKEMIAKLLAAVFG